jgi:mono/diheme cytochrome c family protein
MRMSAVVFAGLSLTLQACSGLDLGPPPRPDPAMVRGAEIALMRCSGCHAISLTATSPNQIAPAFRDLRLRFDDAIWARTLREISEGSHHDMPMVEVDEAEAEDLRAYVEGLR